MGTGWPEWHTSDKYESTTRTDPRFARRASHTAIQPQPAPQLTKSQTPQFERRLLRRRRSPLCRAGTAHYQHPCCPRRSDARSGGRTACRPRPFARSLGSEQFVREHPRRSSIAGGQRRQPFHLDLAARHQPQLETATQRRYGRSTQPEADAASVATTTTAGRVEFEPRL